MRVQLREPEMPLPLPQGFLLCDCESHIGNIIVKITVDNSVRRIALIVTEVGHLVDPVEAVVIEFVIRHADEVALEYGHE